MKTELNLAEELLLLALNEEKGTIVAAASLALPYGLAGALLIELVLAGLARIDGKNLIAEPRGSAGDDLLDGTLATLRAAKRPRRISSWVGGLGRTGGKIRKKLLARLVEKRILGREDTRYFGIFPSTRYPQADPRPEYAVRERVRSAIRGMTRPDERTAALVSLVQACGLIGVLFERSERREARRPAKEIGADQPIGNAVARAVAMVKAAVIGAAGS